jgi:hypothetical protein
LRQLAVELLYLVSFVAEFYIEQLPRHLVVSVGHSEAGQEFGGLPTGDCPQQVALEFLKRLQF